MNRVVFPDNDQMGANVLATYLQELNDESNSDSDTKSRLKILLTEGIQNPFKNEHVDDLQHMYDCSRNVSLTESTDENSDENTKIFTGLQENDFYIQVRLASIPHPTSYGASYTLPNRRGNIIDTLSFEIREIGPSRPVITQVAIHSNGREIATYNGGDLGLTAKFDWKPFPHGFPAYLSVYSQMDTVVFFDAPDAVTRSTMANAIKVWTTVKMPCTKESEIREPAKTAQTTIVRTETLAKTVCVSKGVAFSSGDTMPMKHLEFTPN